MNAMNCARYFLMLSVSKDLSLHSSVLISKVDNLGDVNCVIFLLIENVPGGDKVKLVKNNIFIEKLKHDIFSNFRDK